MLYRLCAVWVQGLWWGNFKQWVTMSKYKAQPSGRERFFEENEIMVSKTDLKGRITYANDVFLDISLYSENEVLGQPHSIIRHPAMPRCIFKYLWDTLEAKQEIFAYIVNMSKNGDHYWVLAHVTPSYDSAGNVVGYHSSRRVPRREALEKIEPLYRDLLAEEERFENRKQGMESAHNKLVEFVKSTGMSYEELMFNL